MSGYADATGSAADDPSDPACTPSGTPPDARLVAPDLDRVEATVRRAIDERRPDLLRLIGNGEFTIALHWSEDGTDLVVKRVPPFTSRRRADDYLAVTGEYLAELPRRGVRCVTTELFRLDRPDGSAVAYHVQPRLDPANLADHLLRHREPSPGDPIVVAVVDATVRVIDPDFGFDAQFANWFWHHDEPWQLDFSTPLLYDADRRIRFDTDGFQREYPAPLRPLIYREFMKIAPRYADTTFVLTDLLSQLIRQGLDPWCDAVATAARDRHGIEISPDLARRRFEEEAAFYPRLLKLKRLQRAWVQRTGRRYDSLLPAATGFGR